MLAAIAAVMRQLEFMLPLAPEFLKLDFSDLPALLAGFAAGPVAAVAVALIKNLIAMLFSKTLFVGELANFIVACLLTVPAAAVYRKWHNRKGAMLGLVCGGVSMTAGAAVLNATLLLPFYANLMGKTSQQMVDMFHAVNGAIDDMFGVVMLCIVPFNLFKWLLLSLLAMLLYKRISPLLKRF